MIRVRITVVAGEKMNPGQYESLERSVSLSIELEVQDDQIGNLDALIAEATQAAQMRAEAQMYAALSRAMSSRNQPTSWLRSAALDRAGRIAPEPIETQTTAAATPDRGVLN